MQTVVFLTIGIASLVPTYHYQVRNIQTITTDSISIYSDIFRTVNGTVLCSCVFFMTLINRHEYCTLMNQMVDFDKDLKQLGVQMDNKTMFKTILCTSIFVYGFLISISTADLLIFALSQDMLTYIYWFGCIYSFFITITATTQLLCFTYLLYKRFVTLNAYISNLSEPDFVDSNVKKIKMWTWTKNNNRVIDISVIAKQALRVKHVKVTSNNEKVNSLSEMHDNLCNVSKTINSLYSLQMLLTTSTAFIVLVTQLYFFYLMLSSNENYVLTFTKVWTAAIWGIVYFIILYSISFACSKTKEEADMSSILLHKMAIDDDDDFTRTSVEMFSLQMLHQKVEFTACGFFPVDFSVLYMIIGAVTTYLVFLIQFEMASRTVSGIIPSSDTKKT
ncbi:putative gustatory receptor 28b [Arctopsyche grandis]|uniref:putative gustatory receptor 28b n=1 Tax=Arctopsyche grandis TaxID=121162 RepID=UPI00406D70CF